MKDDYNYIANGVGVVFSALQSNEMLSWLSWSLTLLATLVSLSFTIYKWWLKARKDGKIDSEEIDELGDIIEDGKKKIDEVNDDVKGK